MKINLFQKRGNKFGVPILNQILQNKIITMRELKLLPGPSSWPVLFQQSHLHAYSQPILHLVFCRLKIFILSQIVSPEQLGDGEDLLSHGRTFTGKYAY